MTRILSSRVEETHSNNIQQIFSLKTQGRCFMRNRYIRHSICLQGVYSIVREIGFISLEMPLTTKDFKHQKLSTTKACPKISIYAIYILIKLLNSRLSLFLDIFYQSNIKTHLPNKAFHFFFT